MQEEKIEYKKYTEGLNNGQKQAFHNLTQFVKSKNGDMFILRGYAGTGKTFLVKRLINYINDTNKFALIAVTAPTNKAVKVLYTANPSNDYRVTYQTVHKLLGLKEVITKDGKQKFEKNFTEQTELNRYKYLIVDEVSMLNDDLFIELITYKERLKIIFMGDPAQIPPVNKDDCIPFSDRKNKFSFKESELTEIMRQKGENPIVEASFEIRNKLTLNEPIPDIQTKLINEKGIVRIQSSDNEERVKLKSLFNQYFNCEEFKQNSDYAKIIAWRNITVEKTNEVIRKLIFGENLNKVMVGEKLIANTPIFIPDTRTILFNTSDEFEVTSIIINSIPVKVGKEIVEFKSYQCKVKYTDIEGNNKTTNIAILHEDGENDFESKLDELKSLAIKFNGEKGAWNRYYDFKRVFADVNYNYVITAHKAQGSTYKNVFIIEDDIDMNGNVLERNRIKYTSYSRPTDILFVVKR